MCRLLTDHLTCRREPPVLYRDVRPRRKQRRACFPEHFDRYDDLLIWNRHNDIDRGSQQLTNWLLCAIEIYRIVSSKALDGGDGAQAQIGAGTNISLSKPADDEANKGGKCC
jgi:hypothetical protein